MLMLPLSASELASMRAEASGAVCILPVVINRVNQTTKQYQLVSSSGLLCGVREPNAGTLQNYEYMVGDSATWHVQFPYGTDVEAMDQLVITMPNSLTNTLIVNKVLAPRSYELLREVLASE